MRFGWISLSSNKLQLTPCIIAHYCPSSNLLIISMERCHIILLWKGITENWSLSIGNTSFARFKYTLQYVSIYTYTYIYIYMYMYVCMCLTEDIKFVSSHVVIYIYIYIYYTWILIWIEIFSKSLSIYLWKFDEYPKIYLTKISL